MRSRKASFVLAFFLASILSSAQQRMETAPGIVLQVPQAWKVKQDTRTTFLLEHVKQDNVLDASIAVQMEKRVSHAEALRRIAEIESESPIRVEYILVGGWPAITRKTLEPVPRAGEQRKERTEPTPGDRQKSYQVTVAVAIGTYVLKLRELLQPNADPTLTEEPLNIARTLSAPAADPSQSNVDLETLRSGTLRPKPQPPRLFGTAISEKTTTRRMEEQPSSLVVGKPKLMRGGTAVGVGGGGEIEAASSLSDGNLVTDASCAISYSTNGGVSFSASSVTGQPTNLDGDCSVTWGPSGNFYLSQLGTEFVALYASTSSSNGAAFSYVTNAVDRTSVNINVDQPHIAADRWNVSSSNGDFVYVVWQETGQFLSRVACSSNSGSSWGTPTDANSGSGGFPRVSIGPDGMVYVASRASGSIVVDKFSSCDSGLTEQSGFPVTIAISDIPCPVPGLDRCNDGNTLSSPFIAVDDTASNHVYLGWAQENVAGTGSDIVIADSNDGGQNFGTPVAANSSTVGTRFMPWLSSWGGTAYVGWYDRSTADSTSADPDDATRYHYGSVVGANSVLTPGADVDRKSVV